MAAAPWFCSFCWSVSLLFAEIDVFAAKLPCLTSPLPDHGLPLVTGALTLDCSDPASLSADCEVSLLLSADWSWLTSWPPAPEPPLGSLPLLTPMAAAPWFCSFCWSVWLLFAEIDVLSAPLNCLTSPLPDHGLPLVTGALTLCCADSASLSADWIVMSLVWTL